MSPTWSAKSGDCAPGCCSSDACSANRGELTSRAIENRGGISRPLTVEDGPGGGAGETVRGRRQFPRRLRPALPGPAEAQIDPPRVQRSQRAERLDHRQRGLVPQLHRA